jgi:hypothetical protein
MITKYSFPISIVDLSGVKTAGSSLLTLTCLNTKQVLEVDVESGDDVIMNIEDSSIDREIAFSFIATSELGKKVIVHNPTISKNSKLEFKVIYQKNEKTGFKHTSSWHDLWLHDKFETIVSIEPDIDHITYVNTSATHELLSNFVGKDHFKNIFFKSEIPHAFEIPVRRTEDTFEVLSKNVKLNNLGYRSLFDYTDTLNDKNIILCLGDSDVFGIFLEYNALWTSLLQQELGNEYVVMNMGVPGYSPDSITRVGVKTIETLKSAVKYVAVQWPNTSMREFVSKTYKGGVYTLENPDVPYQDWWKHIDWHSNNYNYFKNRILLENTCQKYNTRFSDLYLNRNDENAPYDYFTDGIYSTIGPLTHKAIANYFLEKIKQETDKY